LECQRTPSQAGRRPARLDPCRGGDGGLRRKEGSWHAPTRPGTRGADIEGGSAQVGRPPSLPTFHQEKGGEVIAEYGRPGQELSSPRRRRRPRPDSYRLYNCARCHEQVRICSGCDHGNRYCGVGCAAAARRESMREAGRRHQQTRAGRHNHAARMQDYRERRRQKVTHQGSSPQSSLGEPGPAPQRDVPAAAPAPKEDLDATSTPTPRPSLSPFLDSDPGLCAFCHRPCPPFARRTFVHRVLHPP